MITNQDAEEIQKLQDQLNEAAPNPADKRKITQFEAVAEQSTRAVICGLARSLKGDIERAAEAVKPAGNRARVHVFLATSSIHRQFKLNKAKDEIVKQARESYARE